MHPHLHLLLALLPFVVAVDGAPDFTMVLVGLFVGLFVLGCLCVVVVLACHKDCEGLFDSRALVSRRDFID